MLSWVAPVPVGSVLAKTYELNCAELEVSGASIGHGREGAVFRCTISPVTDKVLKALDAAARSEDVVRLLFPKQPLLLERIEVTRVEPGRVQISGRVVDPE